MFTVVTSKQDGLPYCVELWKNPKNGNLYFLYVNLLCFFVLPLGVVFISNVCIWRHVNNRHTPTDSQTVREIHRRTRKGVRKMLSVVTLVFLISWLPLYLLIVRVKFSSKIEETEANILYMLLPVAQLLGSLNSSVNPILYAFLNKKFRNIFRSIIPSWCLFGRKTLYNSRGSRRYVLHQGSGTSFENRIRGSMQSSERSYQRSRLSC